ncbi:MAG: hypothetical protein AB8G15_22375 [Saprospiraceae bacterium]
MKDPKQGKIVSIHTAKSEVEPVVIQAEQEKVAQMFNEMQEISQRIDEHLKESKPWAPLQQLPVEPKKRVWSTTFKHFYQRLFTRFQRSKNGTSFPARSLKAFKAQLDTFKNRFK